MMASSEVNSLTIGSQPMNPRPWSCWRKNPLISSQMKSSIKVVERLTDKLMEQLVDQIVEKTG